MNYAFRKDTWVVTPKAIPDAGIRLICLPFAGGSATAFRDWLPYLPDVVELNAVEIPGRGHRLSEPLIRKIDLLVQAIGQGIKSYLDKPFVIFGHSMGALLGFELTHYLTDQLDAKPLHLFLSGRGAPDRPNREEPIHHLPEKTFIEKIRHYNGTPKQVLEHEELMQIMLPILRSDFEVCETYRYKEKPQLTVPLTVFGGLKDASATPDDLEAWSAFTSGPFARRMFPGDHFFILNEKMTLIQAILRDIKKHSDII